MPPLSVVIVTSNEERNIRAALESAKWADEVVVLDSFSTDSTPDICREYTKDVYQEEWRGFSGQKNRAAELAKNDWVFILDADERITEDLSAEIRALMADRPDKSGYYVARRNHFMGREIRHGGWYPDYSIRLYDKNKGRVADRAVHEAVEVDGGTGCLKNPMLHFTYAGVSDYLGRMERYSSLAASEMLRSGRRATAFDLLARPAFSFVRMFVLKLGALDGLHGLVIAALYSYYTFTKYAKLWELQAGTGGKP